MYECAAECQFLFHATGQFTSRTITEWFDLIIDIFDQIVVFFDGGFEDGSKKIQVFSNRQILVKGKPVRAYSPLYCEWPGSL